MKQRNTMSILKYHNFLKNSNWIGYIRIVFEIGVIKSSTIYENMILKEMSKGFIVNVFIIIQL